MENEKISLIIDGRKVEVSKGTTVMHAAEEIDIHIPRLCYHPKLSIEGACRVCIVDIEGARNWAASCATEATEGMVVKTNTPEIRLARRDIVELLLDNHPQDCQTCERNGSCELQSLSYDLGIRERLFAGVRKEFKLEDSSFSIIKDSEKCILCQRCIRVCDEIQGVHTLSQHWRGVDTVVAPAFENEFVDSVCINCGQCINVCPTDALQEKRFTDDVEAALADPKKHVIVQTAPAIRAALGEGFGMEPGTPVTGEMVSALRHMGFDAVFDTNFGADLTIMEEGTEFLDRLANGGALPLITSCSPGWVKFMEHFYPEMIPNMSTCKSPMAMTSALAKTYYAEKNGIDPKDVYVVAIMPCTAKKFESRREELYTTWGEPETDSVLTTRELVWMIKSHGIDFLDLPKEEFDNPLGESTGAADIFGATGGVLEAALRTAIELKTGKVLEDIDFKQIRGVTGVKTAELDVDGIKLKVAVANGLENAKILLERVKAGEEFHMIEVMACPGGCIGGGGQPYPPKGTCTIDFDLYEKRAQALYSIDREKAARQSHHNKSVLKVYKEFLGEIGGHKAHELLHTTYVARKPKGIK